MVWFPFNYRDISGWRSEGIELGTASNEAAKHMDAYITQVVFADRDPMYDEGANEALEKAKKADPGWILPDVLSSSFTLGTFHEQKLFDVNGLFGRAKGLSAWEEGHLSALARLNEGDVAGALKVYDRNLLEHPKDQASLLIGYVLGLFSGQRHYNRDLPAKVAHHYHVQDRFYGILHGQLAMGYDQCGQLDLAEKSVEIALAHTPNNILAIHGAAHLWDSRQGAEKGIELLESNEAGWRPRTSTLVFHLWWHMALYHLELGDFESALSVWDERMKVQDVTDKPFELADAASLLMRLELEGQPRGVDLKDRWREVAQAYEDIQPPGRLMFFDYNHLVAFLYGDPPPGKLADGLMEDLKAAASSQKVGRHYGEVFSKVGLAVCEGLAEFAGGNFAECADLLYPVRREMTVDVGGSIPQLALLSDVLIRACINAKHPFYGRMAEQLIEERVARNGCGKANQTLERMAACLI